MRLEIEKVLNTFKNIKVYYNTILFKFLKTAYFCLKYIYYYFLLSMLLITFYLKQ